MITRRLSPNQWLAVAVVAGLAAALGLVFAVSTILY